MKKAKAAREERGEKRKAKSHKPPKPPKAPKRQKPPRQTKQAPPPRAEGDNLFNRASSQVHGYSSRMGHFLRLSISLRTSVGYSLLLLRLFLPLALILTGFYAYLQAPNYIARQQAAIELLPSPESAGVEWVQLAADAEPTGVAFGNGWGFYWQNAPARLMVQYLEPYQGGTAQILFPLEEDWRVLRGLLLALLVMVLFTVFSFVARGHNLNRRLFRPLQDITETAQQMNEKNLSARINVAGTQNELRDLAVVINDMLERIEAAYNRQKQFVSDASHELRTPIAVLQGYAGLLERWGKDNPDVRDEAISAIASETRSMKELVENLLFLARHDKKTLSLTMEPFDAAEMLRELVKETEIIAADHTIRAGDIARCTLTADRATVKQAVRIFIENALKYTPPGGYVAVSSQMQSGALFITVSDNGCGIKKSDLPRVFDRFYRADDARSSATGGHGLGLAIARIICVSHGGKIHVKSQLGQGSDFTLELPMGAGETL
ncbi:MAG: HAMP domain-containing histidine kinase [Oscillospiraceae bacterium]|jgi:signal transduction histidine kinase|nr:HAMP domain-containing histidine kinase [Oscillospiraceae bacterium]